MKAKELLSAEQQRRVVGAIMEAETNTSGEIRVHIDDKCSGDPMERAAFIFRHIGMDRTKDRNGVLIYLASQSKVFAIIGDDGIDKVVPQGYWDEVCMEMGLRFKAGDFTEGLARAARSIGDKLKEFFPYREDDVNELPDEISFNKD